MCIRDSFGIDRSPSRYPCSRSCHPYDDPFSKAPNASVIRLRCVSFIRNPPMGLERFCTDARIESRSSWHYQSRYLTAQSRRCLCCKSLWYSANSLFTNRELVLWLCNYLLPHRIYCCCFGRTRFLVSCAPVKSKCYHYCFSTSLHNTHVLKFA